MKALDQDGLDYVVDKIYDLVNSGGSADYIVEEGQSGIWTYRKWASGVAECWGTYTASKTGASTAMLGLSGAVYETGSITFPFTFVETPSVTFGGNVGGQNTAIAYGRASTTDCACEMVSATGTRVMNVSIHVKGLWKEFTPSAVSSNYQLQADYVVEQGTSGNWKYRKFSSGQSEAWYTGTVSISTNTAWGSMYFSGNPTQISIPTGIFNSRPTVNIDVGNNSYMLGASTLTGTSANAVSFYIYNSIQVPSSFTVYVDIHCSGTWK